MTALLKILITIFFVAILLWLTFANREAVMLTWSPLHEPSAVPVAVLVLGATIGGFIWGGLIVWLNSAPLRRDRRRTEPRLEPRARAGGVRHRLLGREGLGGDDEQRGARIRLVQQVDQRATVDVGRERDARPAILLLLCLVLALASGCDRVSCAEGLLGGSILRCNQIEVAACRPE